MASDPTYPVSKPSRWPINVDAASAVMIAAFGFVGVLYYSFYEPTANSTVSDAFVIAFVACWLVAGLTVKMGLVAASRLGPNMLVASNARMTTTEWHPTRLYSTYGAIDRDALRAVRAPKDLIPEGPVVPEPGTNGDGQEVVMKWAMLGGGKILNFYSNPNKGVLVYPEPWIAALGQGSRHIYFSPFAIYALPQAAIPAQWITEFESKAEGWFKRGDPVYILHGRDPSFDTFLVENMRWVQRVIAGKPEPKHGGWDADALLNELLRAWTRNNFDRNVIAELENALEHRAGLIEGRARRELAIVRRDPGDEPPSYSLSRDTPADFRLR